MNGEGTHTVEFWAEDYLGRPSRHAPATFTISADRASVIAGRAARLSGRVTPVRTAGSAVSVEVKKPGKAYWTYSSRRGISAQGAAALWSYAYLFKAGMTRGLCHFHARFDGNGSYLPSVSRTVAVRLR